MNPDNLFLHMAIIIFALTPVVSQACQEESQQSSFSVSGIVLGAEEQPVVGSVVIPLSQYGIPLDRSGVPLTMQSMMMSGSSDEDFILSTATDKDGRFTMKLAPGKYRFVAQTWLDKQTIEKILDKNGSRLRFDGMTEIEFDTELGASETLEIKPVGTATVRLTSQEASDMLMVSTNRLAADPALGIIALDSNFIAGLIAGARMEGKEILISGLPSGEIQFFSIVNDNNGGMGGTLATAIENETTDVYVGVIAGWSNGHRTPPPELESLTEYFVKTPEETNKVNARLKELQEQHSGSGNQTMEDRMKSMQQLLPHLKEDYQLANGETVTFGDAMAAMTYARMQKKK